MGLVHEKERRSEETDNLTVEKDDGNEKDDQHCVELPSRCR
jgi:hypothetical protein